MDGRIKVNIVNMKQKLFKNYENNILKNISLSTYSWFNLGGPAEYLFKPDSKSQLIEFLNDNLTNDFKITIIGAGSNILFRDNGIKGVVIKLGKGFSYINLIAENEIEVGAATLDKKVANFARDNNICNLEFLSCIPGSIGGAITMNSGCYGHDISKILTSITVVDLKNSQEKVIKSKDIKFYYRGTNLPDDLIIVSARLKGNNSSMKIIEKTQNEMLEKKKLSQPSQIKTCGSTFKNVNSEKKAWMLIKESGCAGFKEGDAEISKKHCNFFVNNGKANSLDIENLILRVKKAVNDKTGINLDLEIKIIGD
tara:strand:- start:700 stop:1632 length:933 start_codon:yes stop_codon:yes gene_type:complete